MDIYTTSILITAIICIVMISCGIWFYKFTPSFKNPLGYKTKAASKSQEAWTAAHQYAGKGWIGTGVCVLVISAVILIFSRIEFSHRMSMGLTIFQIVAALIVIPFTESMLNDYFDEEGHRKK